MSQSGANVLSPSSWPLMYGDHIKLNVHMHTSRFKAEGNIGVYHKVWLHGSVAAVPPLKKDAAAQFEESLFTVLPGQSRAGKTRLIDMKQGPTEVRYGEPVVLVDQKGKVWNNKTGGVTGYLGCRAPKQPGELHVSFVAVAEGETGAEDRRRAGSAVMFGDRVMFDIAHSHRKRVQWDHRLTLFKKASSRWSQGGGYIVCDGQGDVLIAQLIRSRSVSAISLVEHDFEMPSQHMHKQGSEQKHESGVRESRRQLTTAVPVPWGDEQDVGEMRSQTAVLFQFSDGAEARVRRLDLPISRPLATSLGAALQQRGLAKDAMSRSPDLIGKVPIWGAPYEGRGAGQSRSELIYGYRCVVPPPSVKTLKTQTVNFLVIGLVFIYWIVAWLRSWPVSLLALLATCGAAFCVEKVIREFRHEVRGRKLRWTVWPLHIAYTTQADVDPAAGVPQRFIRAEKGDRAKAGARYATTMRWRKEQQVDLMLSRPHTKFKGLKQLTTHYYHKRDKGGHPCYFDRPGTFSNDRMNSLGLNLDDLTYHYTFIMEYLWRVIDADDNQTCTTVMDLTGITSPTGEIIEFVKRLTAVTQEHYPERTHKMFLLNVPLWFKLVWNLIAPMLDKNTQAKITVLRSDYKATLIEHIGVENLPAEYGGSCTCPGGCATGAPEERHMARLVAELNGEVPATQVSQCISKDGGPATASWEAFFSDNGLAAAATTAAPASSSAPSSSSSSHNTPAAAPSHPPRLSATRTQSFSPSSQSALAAVSPSPMSLSRGAPHELKSRSRSFDSLHSPANAHSTGSHRFPAGTPRSLLSSYTPLTLSADAFRQRTHTSSSSLLSVPEARHIHDGHSGTSSRHEHR